MRLESFCGTFFTVFGKGEKNQIFPILPRTWKKFKIQIQRSKKYFWESTYFSWADGLAKQQNNGV